MTVNLETVAYLTVLVGGIGIVINALELIAIRTAIYDFFNWDLLSTKYFFLIRRPKLLRLISRILSNESFVIILFIQIASVITLMVSPLFSLPLGLICLLVLLIHILIHFRLVYGIDGSDQFQTMVWSGLTFFYFSSAISSKMIAVCFIAGQFILAYMSSGIAKIISPVWRSGQALGGIIHTENYGQPELSRIIKKFRLSPFLSWVTMFIEIIGPLSFLLGKQAVLIFISISLVFHICIAIVMGLNSFVWAFAAGYPSLYYLSEKL